MIGPENLPFGRTTITFRFNRAGQPPEALLEDVVTPQPGRLRVTVLSDDDGR